MKPNGNKKARTFQISENDIEKTYFASGYAIGHCWGGGVCGYMSIIVKSDNLPDLDAKIKAGIKDGSLDGGMGYENIIGAVMEVRTNRIIVIGGKVYRNTETAIRYYTETGKTEELPKTLNRHGELVGELVDRLVCGREV